MIVCVCVCVCVTGIDDPYEEPQSAECVLEAYDSQGKQRQPEHLAADLLQYLQDRGLLQAPEAAKKQ